MSDVAAAAGVGRATVYRYFATREALIDELAVVALHDAEARLTEARLDDVSVQEALTRIVRALMDVGDAFVAVIRERRRRDDFNRILTVPLIRTFERGQAECEIRDDLPPSWLVDVLVTLIVVIPSASPPRGREDTVAAIVSTFMDGARSRGPRSGTADGTGVPARR